MARSPRDELVDQDAAARRLKEEVRRLRRALEATAAGRLLLRQREEFSRLLAVSQVIVSELDIARVHELVATQARELVGAEAVLVPILDEARERYTYVAAIGPDAEAVRGASFAASVGMCGWVLRHGRSLLFGETSTHWMDGVTPWEAGQQSAVLVPLIGRKGILGGLSAIGKQGGGCFTQHDLDLLTMFANGVSTAIENARLFRELTREIEDRRQAERALLESESMLRQVLDTMPHSVFWKDRDGVYRGCNEVFARAVGRASPAEVVGCLDDDLPWPRTEAESYRRDDHEVVASGRPKLHIVEPLQQADGSRLWIETSKVPLHDARGSVVGVLGAFQDVTERRQAQEMLRRSEEFSRTILDTIDEGLVVVDRDFRIRIANQAYLGRVARCPRGAVIGQPCHRTSHASERPCFELGISCAVRQVFEDGSPHSVLHEHVGPDGDTRYVETRAFPLRDSEGQMTAAIEVFSDVTERRLLEEERLRSQKLEAVGTLAGGIAHDFNNLLQAVFGCISLARIQAVQGEPCADALAEAEGALRMSVQLTKQLLAFSKGGQPAKKTFDLLPVVQQAARLALSGSNATLQVSAEASPCAVDADEGQIFQVIQNIVLNAGQAMPAGGRVDIALRSGAAPVRVAGQELAGERHVAIEIQDTGSGIRTEHLARIFDPYFTTKEKGSGLGLATSYAIVKHHGGAIDVRSVLGEGTVFTIYLPAATANELPAEGGRKAAATPRRAGHVLIMDDEPAIRDIVSRLIRRLGHRAEAAADGAAALEMYQAARVAGDPFEVVILDLTVRGGMGGEEALRRLLAFDPDVAAVVSSGYSDGAGIAAHVERGFKASLTKPYAIGELKAVLDRLLGD